MRKQALRILTGLTLLAGLALTPVFGQITRAITADIPFAFVVLDMTFPAGKYTIQTVDERQVTLLIRSADGRPHAVLMTNGRESRSMKSHTYLVFNRYADRYFLAQVWQSGSHRGREVVKSRAERELAKKQSRPELVRVPADRASDGRRVSDVSGKEE